jgi:diguanylate cyclase (GGDEF)-like protein
LSTALYVAGDFLLQPLAMVVANSTLVGGFMLIYVGILDFFGHRPNVRRLMLLLLLVVTLITWFSTIQANYKARVMIVTLTDMLVLSFCARATFQADRCGVAGCFTSIAFLSAALISGLHFLAIFLEYNNTTTMMDATLWQKFYLASLSFSGLMMTIGLIMMANERLRQLLEYTAGHDALTGVYNRGAFMDLMRKEIARTKRHGRPLALLMFDLDHFKQINDEYGHPTGDKVIIDFVCRTEFFLRESDFFGRYGGEEFIALLPETTLEQANLVATRICQDTAAAVSADLPAYTVSIGATATNNRTISVDTLMGLADQALYQAKQSGRNRVAFIAESTANQPIG